VRLIHFTLNTSLSIGDEIDTRTWERSRYWENQFTLGNRASHAAGLVPIIDAFRSDLKPLVIPEIAERGIALVQSHVAEMRAKIEVLKEMLFEEHRRDHFPGLPCRYRCAFFLEETPEAVAAIERFGTGFGKRQQYVFESTYASNVFHKADSALLNCNQKSPGEIKIHADNYWRGTTFSPTPQYEILAEGKFRVVERR